MGFGYEVKCEKCGYRRNILLGMGFSNMFLCEEALGKMKSGKMGKGFQKAVNSIENPAVHRENELFVCDKCGQWRVDEVIELCEPTVEGMDLTSVTGAEIGEEYRVVRSKKHRCSKCRSFMREAKMNGELSCPDCGEKLKKHGMIHWD